MSTILPYATAAGAGILSFLSPCVLPLVPAYLSYMAGATFEDISGSGEQRLPVSRVVLPAASFVLGFAIVFMILGASASAIHRIVFEHLDIISKVAGALIVLFGIHFAGLLRLPFLNFEARFHLQGAGSGPVSAFAIGLAFAFGWTPCLSPILSTILALAAREDSLARGVSLLGVYALGLGVPFIAAALAVRPFLAFAARYRRYMRAMEVITGLLLIATGTLIFFNAFTIVSGWFLETFPALEKFG
jgi:cytochrome c-type biogenesis protein